MGWLLRGCHSSLPPSCSCLVVVEAVFLVVLGESGRCSTGYAWPRDVVASVMRFEHTTLDVGVLVEESGPGDTDFVAAWPPPEKALGGAADQVGDHMFSLRQSGHRSCPRRFLLTGAYHPSDRAHRRVSDARLTASGGL